MNYTGKQLITGSKFLSLLLRHKPETVGLVLDENGWASVEEIIERTASEKTPITRAMIEQVMSMIDKKRFELSEDGSRIRAYQGHSIDIDLDLKEATPPEVLWHGTSMRAMKFIADEHIKKMGRAHVHLSADRETALTVGKRHGKPVLIRIDTVKMLAAGFKFYVAGNGVWLVDSVPIDFFIEVQYPWP